MVHAFTFRSLLALVSLRWSCLTDHDAERRAGGPSVPAASSAAAGGMKKRPQARGLFSRPLTGYSIAHAPARSLLSPGWLPTCRRRPAERLGDEPRSFLSSASIALLGTALCFLVVTPDTTDPILWAATLVSHSQDEHAILLN